MLLIVFILFYYIFSISTVKRCKQFKENADGYRSVGPTYLQSLTSVKPIISESVVSRK